MKRLIRPTIIVMLALLAPVVPFLFFGDGLNERIEAWLDQELPASVTFMLVSVVLAGDVLLPVPSSAVSTFGGSRLGFIGGTAASWLGMTAGAILGFALARWLGRPLAERLARPDDLQRLETLGRRHGPWLLAVVRAVPVLAEASVLLLGVTRLEWRRFLWPVALSNLGIAAAYSAFGQFAAERDALLPALIASIALPLAAVAVARMFLPRSVEPQ